MKRSSRDITGRWIPLDRLKVSGNGAEYWSARDLMPLLGYDSWRRFEDAIDRARSAAEVQGYSAETLFAGAVKKTGGRPQQDFEREGFEFDKQAAREQIYASKWKKSIKQESTTPFRRGFTINPDRVGGVPQAGDSLLWGTINERGYDFGLEPVSRRLVKVTPRLYLKDALMGVRFDKVQSRKVKPLPPRGADGRFTKGG